MMNRKETMLMTIVGMAVLTTVTTLSSSTQALALGHWNIDEDYVPNNEFAEDGMDSSSTADNPDEEEEDNGEDSITATDEDEEESSGIPVVSSTINSNSEEEDSSSVAYTNLQACLSNLGESPTEQQV